MRAHEAESNDTDAPSLYRVLRDIEIVAEPLPLLARELIRPSRVAQIEHLPD